MRTYTLFVIPACAFFVASLANAVTIPAFPGAEGNGATTPAGRGGEIYLVTSLDDDGEGTLREACEAEAPRIVIINVGGIIELQSPIEIRHPFITIAGQVAPGDGVCLKNYGLKVSTHDVVIRYLRIRPGDAAGVKTPGIAIANGERVVVDHCSISWTTGPAVSVSSSADDITLQWNMFTESLFDTDADAGKSGTGVSLSGESSTFSIHHNYFAHLNTGSPHISGAPEAPGPILDFRNNIVYDWGVRSGDSASNVSRYNIIGNAYKAGPSTADEVRGKAFRFGSIESRIFARDNALAGSDMVSAVNFFLWTMPEEFISRIHFRVFRPNDPFEAESVRTFPTETVLRRVLAESGATRPARDKVDSRVITQNRLGAGRLINTPMEVEGWPDYQSGEPGLDTDSDGMPDEWEHQFGLSLSDPADSLQDSDGDGYTNIEEFLNTTQPAAPLNQ